MDDGEKSSTILPKFKGKIHIFIHKNVIENKDNDDYVIDRFIVGKNVNCVHIYLCSYVLDFKNNRNFYHILVITDHRN